MLSLVGVDLAAKYSAVCWMTHLGSVLSEWDSWGSTEERFVQSVVAPFQCPAPPAVLVVEDLPHRLPFSHLVKTVCRLQGRIAHAMDALGFLDRVLFVAPAQWRAGYTGLERGTGPDAVLPVAAGQGYTPPDLSHRIIRAGHKAIARKVATDYAAAYLIARWTLTTFESQQTFDVPGTARYGTQPIKARK